MNDHNYIESLLVNEGGNKTTIKHSLDFDSILRDVCAYLNMDGGWIVVVGGDDNAQRINDVTVKDLERRISTDISPLPFVYVSLESFKGHPAILITVVKGGRPPYSYKGRFYVEADGIVMSPTTSDLSKLLRDSESYSDSWEANVSLKASMADLDGKLITDVRQHATDAGRIKTFMDSDNDNFLSGLSLINYEFVKNGAVALFGDENESIMPQCHVKIQLMEHGETGDVFSDYDCYGNIFSLMDWTYATLKSLLPTISKFGDDNLSREDSPAYPLPALREAIVNSLIHCDYSDVTSEIRILVYPDKLTIINAGEMKAKLKKGVNLSGSVLRNPLMAEVLYIDGRMEKTGRGIPMITNSVKEYGYRMPEWKSADGFTSLTIYRCGPSIPPRCEEFILSIAHGTTFTRKDYENYFERKISPETAKKDIKQLVDSGLCVLKGNGRSSSYYYL